MNLPQDSTDTPDRGAAYDPTRPALVITSVTVTEPAVVAEARRWPTGRRGAVATEGQMAGADLTPFVTQALLVGTQAIATAGGVQDTYDLERLVREVGTRTSASTDQAAALTGKAAADAAKAVGKASEDARKALGETEAATRKTFTDSVAAAGQALQAQLQQIFGGENPELLDKLRPVLASFSTDLNKRVTEQTQQLLEKAAKQFDPADPTSPMARHQHELEKQRKELAETLAKQHQTLAGKVDELAGAIKVTTAAQQAAAKTASVTPLKGNTYADRIHAVMAEVAAGLGDEYVDTGALTGVLPRCKKGDGVLTIGGGQARVVLEMTDSHRSGWNDYLDEAERNREAAASIGLVRDADQNAGQCIRVLGPRRLVMAFDPSCDDPDLLRTVVQLLRISAVAASSRRDIAELETAEERVAEARQLLSKIDTIGQAAKSIRKNADKIDRECNTVQTDIDRLLCQALDALGGVAIEAADLSGPTPQDAESRPHGVA